MWIYQWQLNWSKKCKADTDGIYWAIELSFMGVAATAVRANKKPKIKSEDCKIPLGKPVGFSGFGPGGRLHYYTEGVIITDKKEENYD